MYTNHNSVEVLSVPKLASCLEGTGKSKGILDLRWSVSFMLRQIYPGYPSNKGSVCPEGGLNALKTRKILVHSRNRATIPKMSNH